MKRILCFSTILVLVICSCVPIAFADDEDTGEINIVEVSDEKNDDEITATDIYNPMQGLLEGIGIEIDKSVSSSHSAKITRGEFVKLFMQFITMPITSGNDEKMYADVKDTILNYALRIALDMGCVSEADYFYPDSMITYAQAYKIAVCALGYQKRAEQLGGYPYGYSAIASRLDLDDAISASLQDEMSYYDFFTLVENAGNAVLGVYSSGSYVYVDYYTNGETLFEAKKIIKVKGIVAVDSHSALYVNSVESREGYINIDNTEYLCEESFPLGSSVEGYAYDDRENLRIIAMRDLSERLRINFDEIEGKLENNVLKYSEDGSKVKMARLDDVLAVLYNGKAFPSYSSDDFVINSGYIELTDNDRDNVFEVAHIRQSETLFVNKINAYERKIFDMNTGLAFDGSDEDVQCIIYYKGKEISLHDISLGSVIKMYKSKDGELVEMYVSTDQLKASVQVQDHENNKVTIGNTEYSLSTYFNTYYSKRLKIGLKYTFVIDNDNYIAAIMDDEYIIDYGYLLYAGKKTIGSKIELGIFTQFGELTVFEMNKNIKYNGLTKKSADVYSSLVDGEGKVIEQLIRYSLNSEGKIKMIDTASPQTGIVADDSNPEDRLTKYIYKDYGDSTVQKTFRTKGNIFVNNFAMSNFAACFIVRPQYDANGRKTDIYDRCDVLNLSNGDKFYANSFDVYDLNSSMIASALVYYDSAVPAPDVSSTCAVVEKVRRGITRDGADALILSVYDIDGKFNTYYIDDFSIIHSDAETAANKIACGDIIRYKLDEDKKTIIAIEHDFDYSAATVNNYQPTAHGLNSREYYYGDVNRYKDDMMLLTARSSNNVTPNMSDQSIQTLLYVENPVVAVVDVANRIVSEGTKYDIVSYQDSAQYSTLIVYMNSAEAKFVVIYK